MKYSETLFKSAGVLWNVKPHYGEWVINQALCPNETCRSLLRRQDNDRSQELYCGNCDREFPMAPTLEAVKREAQRRFVGFRSLDYQVYSLDLPPTTVAAKDEDDNYWIKVRLTERQGKRVAVIYIGQKMKEQTAKDYVQLFVDLDDEAVRFDKGNKNPLKLLAKLTVEFPSSTAEFISHELGTTEAEGQQPDANAT